MSRLLIFSFFLLAIGVECLQLPMYQRDSYRQKMIREKNLPELRKINNAVIKHHRSIIDAAKNGQFASSSQPFYDYSDQEFNIRVSVGTPPQMFEVLLETSIANFWVVDKKCNGSDECPLFCQAGEDFCKQHCRPKCCSNSTSFEDPNPCKGKHQFDQSKSSTYKQDNRPFKIPLGLGSISGILGIDTVTLGDENNKVLIRDTTFAQAQVIGDEFGQLPLDGMLGLAYQAVAADNVTPVFQHALDLKLYDEPIFTIWLPSYGISSVDKSGGSLTFGSKDPKNCKNDAEFVDLVNEIIWWVKVFGVNARSKKQKQERKTNENAIISLGSTMLLMGNKDLMNLVKVSGATYDFDFGMYNLPCDADFTWSVNIGSSELNVPSKNLIWKFETGKCLLAAESWGDAPHPIDLVLGVPFLRSYCNIFDVGSGRIGFATKINQN